MLCIPGHSIFACLVAQYFSIHPSFPISSKPHPPHLGNTAHLLLITSCPSLSLTCVRTVFWFHMQSFVAFSFGLISSCQPAPADFKLCLYQFVFLSAYPHSCLVFCLTALEFDLDLSTCGFRCFTGSDLVITSTTLFPVQLLD